LKRAGIGSALLLWMVPWMALAAGDGPQVSFEQGDGSLAIGIGGQPFATYVWKDQNIPRPYFCGLRAPNGAQVTRNHPPIEGTDRTDHADYHPGLWLAFGDIDGADFWRNKARVRHERFVKRPEGGAGAGSFSVENVYENAEGTDICREVCAYRFFVRPEGYLLLCDSTFSSAKGDFVFGDQEEMGLGVRVATPLMVDNGGVITNSEGLKNEAEVWGKTAAWCDYGGVADGMRIGICLMPHPENFRPSWFHARDYGLLLANPFGRNAFTGAAKSAVKVRQGQTFVLRFGVLVYAAQPSEAAPGPKGYQDYLALSKSTKKEEEE